MPELADRVFVLPNGVDKISASPVDTPRSGALYLSRLHEKKQTLDLIKAWSRLETGARLTVAGWGDAAYQEQVATAAASTTNVSFVGSLYGEAKSAAFNAAKFFILPSLSEGLPMAVLEALQHGCIPIITDSCNLPELFADDIAFRMATDFSDFDAVVSRALAMTESELAARSAAARTYSQRYLWSEIARAMLAQYETILSAKGTR
jgi:glycosyltransferase involved in cell wall biosynthesis